MISKTVYNIDHSTSSLLFIFIVSIQENVEKCLDNAGSDQCGQIWRNFATLAKILNVFAIFLRVYLVFGKMLSLLWQFFCYWANLHCGKLPQIELLI